MTGTETSVEIEEEEERDQEESAQEIEIEDEGTLLVMMWRHFLEVTKKCFISKSIFDHFLHKVLLGK